MKKGMGHQNKLPCSCKSEYNWTLVRSNFIFYFSIVKPPLVLFDHPLVNMPKASTSKTTTKRTTTIEKKKRTFTAEKLEVLKLDKRFQREIRTEEFEKLYEEFEYGEEYSDLFPYRRGKWRPYEKDSLREGEVNLIAYISRLPDKCLTAACIRLHDVTETFDGIKGAIDSANKLLNDYSPLWSRSGQTHIQYRSTQRTFEECKSFLCVSVSKRGYWFLCASNKQWASACLKGGPAPET